MIWSHRCFVCAAIFDYIHFALWFFFNPYRPKVKHLLSYFMLFILYVATYTIFFNQKPRHNAQTPRQWGAWGGMQLCVNASIRFLFAMHCGWMGVHVMHCKSGTACVEATSSGGAQEDMRATARHTRRIDTHTHTHTHTHTGRRKGEGGGGEQSGYKPWWG